MNLKGWKKVVWKVEYMDNVDKRIDYYSPHHSHRFTQFFYKGKLESEFMWKINAEPVNYQQWEQVIKEQQYE